MDKETQDLVEVYRRLHFSEDAAIYTAKKIIQTKRRIDRKYPERAANTPFLSLSK